MKKRMSAAAILLSVLMLVSACSSAPAQTSQGDVSSSGGESQTSQAEEFVSDPNLNEPGELPIVKEPVTLTIAYSATTDLDENYAAQYIEVKTGVDIEWNLSPVDQYKEKLNLMLAGNEVIDLIIPPNNLAAKLNKVEEYKYATQGMLTPLNDYIEYSSKNVKALYEEFPVYYESITAPDGNIYSFQTVNRDGVGTYHGTASYKMWINKTWLDRLGLDMPTTTEEFYEVLKAFKEEDANGNGDPNDEIPLSTCISGANVQIDGFLMNAFTYNDPNPNNTCVYLRVNDDGQIEASVTDPAYREGLRYLNRLYNEGLLYPDSFTQDRATQTALNEAGDAARIGAMPAQHCGYLVASMTESDRWMEYESLVPLKGPEGVQITPTPHFTAEAFPTGLIPTTSEHPETAFRLIDSLFTEEFFMVINYGEEGKSWRPAEDGELNNAGEPADIMTLQLTESDPYFNNNKLSGSPTILPKAPSAGDAQDPKAPNGAGHEVVLYRATEEMEPYKVDQKYVIPNIYYSTEANEKISSYRATINPYIEESIARFITGDLSLDNDWQGYLDELDAMGLQDYLATVQEAYDEWKATANVEE